MNKEELIKAVNEGAMFTEEGDRVLYEQQVIDLIEQSLSGHSIVSDQILKEIREVLSNNNWRGDLQDELTVAMLSAAKGE